ncbi:hypothetical protein [Bradyrhizobium ivorense]|uniref:hypothetical protein n=1 Tax=Bradyrhizobium ivorense TaxID=2511166 RepID=UPI0010B9EAA8|nr:hypothetical protein [Bradyrhizobium ivorense]VIO71686.1 Glutamate mutase sigma subunit [Bradyrhizobium ivorense]
MSTLLASAPEQTSNDGLIIIGVAESDAHVVANKLIDYELLLVGYNVINLGLARRSTNSSMHFRANPKANAVIMEA